MSDEERQPPLIPPPDGPGRRLGPYEQSLRDHEEQIARAVARRAARRRRHRIVAVLAALAVLAGGAYAVMAFLGEARDTPTATSTSAVPTHCSKPNTVRLAVPASIGPALTEVAATLADRADGPCTTFELKSMEAPVAVRMLATGDRPDGWVVDSPVWLDQAAAAGTRVTPAEPFASSAIVVAMSPQRAQGLLTAPSWTDLTKGPDAVRFPNAYTSTVGLLSLSAVAAAVPAPELARVVTEAARAPAAATDPASLARAQPVPAVPVAEAALESYNRANSANALAAVAPREGAPQLEFSLVTTTDDPAATASLKALATYLSSDDAKKTLTTYGFRVPGGSGSPTGEPTTGSVKVTGPPAADVVTRLRSLWSAAAPRRQVLVAADVSAAMLDRTDQGTRMSVVQEALRTGFASLPDSAGTSLWVFSNHIGVRGDDFSAVTSYGPMGQAEHRVALEKGIVSFVRTVGGGRGLYDSILAAYMAAKNAFAAGQTNVAVVIVGGPNEDDYGLNDAQLRAKLTAAKDPKRPVELDIIGISSTAPAEVLTSLTTITGGRYTAAPEPEDLRRTVVRAIAGS